ncbi:MAG: helix-hairpin-helix domain-containing protein [Tunicatimonas sp.]
MTGNVRDRYVRLRKWLRWTGLILFLIPLGSVAQERAYDEALETLLEDLFTPQDEDTDYEAQYELLAQWYAQPLNLNEATADDLRQFYVLSERQISNLLRQRELYGDFLTVNELSYVPAWDLETIRRVLPFVTVAPRPITQPSWHERLADADQLFIVRHEATLERKLGYRRADTLSDHSDVSHYQGSPHKLYARWQLRRRNDFSAGITAEKDAGETLGWHPAAGRYGTDYHAAHLQIEDQGRLRQLTLGDYRVQAGQGLLFGSGFAIGKGAEPVRTVVQTQNAVRPHTAATENGFFRGAAATVSLPAARHALELTTLASYQRQDGRVDSISGRFEALQSTGLHRTSSERTAQNQVGERVLGASLLFRDEARRWQVGLNYVHTRFSHHWQRSNQLRNRHEFAGRQNQAASAFFNYRTHPVHVFGEVARSSSGGLGAVGGTTVYLSSVAELAVLLRHYRPDFHTFYGNAFSEGTRSINERGMYWGLKLQPWRRLTVATYYDRFYFPWLRYRVDAPSDGYEFFTRLSYPFSARTEAWLQFRQESKAINVDDDSLTVRLVLPGVKRSLAVHFTHHLNDHFRLRTRVQHSTYALPDSTTSGFAIAQDVSATRGRWKADARFALFDTDFVNRQYVYENDVLYAFAIPAYSGSGVRNYLLLRYRASRHVSVWAKVARTTFYDREVVGTGLEEIEENHRTDVKFQVVVKW